MVARVHSLLQLHQSFVLGLWLRCVIPCVGTVKPPTARGWKGIEENAPLNSQNAFDFAPESQNHTMSLPLKAVLNVRSPAREWQGCAKPGGIFQENFNWIHLYLFLNIALNYMVVDCIFLLKNITKKVIFFLFQHFSDLKLNVQQMILKVTILRISKVELFYSIF